MNMTLPVCLIASYFSLIKLSTTKISRVTRKRVHPQSALWLSVWSLCWLRKWGAGGTGMCRFFDSIHLTSSMCMRLN